MSDNTIHEYCNDKVCSQARIATPPHPHIKRRIYRVWCSLQQDNFINQIHRKLTRQNFVNYLYIRMHCTNAIVYLDVSHSIITGNRKWKKYRYPHINKYCSSTNTTVLYTKKIFLNSHRWVEQHKHHKTDIKIVSNFGIYTLLLCKKYNMGKYFT